MFRIVRVRPRVPTSPLDPTNPHAGRSRIRRAAAAGVRAAAIAAAVTAVVSAPTVAYAAGTDTALLAVHPLGVVIANLQAWVMSLLAAVATLYLVLGGVFRVLAGGDPAQVERANVYFRNALVGYALAVLAPVLLQIVQGIVGG
jgi:hypothetical protein